jgi:hypothetical protein
LTLLTVDFPHGFAGGGEGFTFAFRPTGGQEYIFCSRESTTLKYQLSAISYQLSGNSGQHGFEVEVDYARIRG